MKPNIYSQIFFQNEVRAGKKIYDTQRAHAYGPYDKWHHIPCFVKQREELEYFDSGDAMAGFMTLGPEDQEHVKTSIKAMKRKNPENGVNGKDEPDSKKIKIEKEDPKEKEVGQRRPRLVRRAAKTHSEGCWPGQRRTQISHGQSRVRRPGCEGRGSKDRLEPGCHRQL